MGKIDFSRNSFRDNYLDLWEKTKTEYTQSSS